VNTNSRGGAGVGLHLAVDRHVLRRDLAVVGRRVDRVALILAADLDNRLVLRHSLAQLGELLGVFRGLFTPLVPFLLDLGVLALDRQFFPSP